MSDDRTTDMIGSESGSTFWMTGGSTCGGRLRIAPETFSRTSLAASLMSRSSTKRRVTVALPSLMRCASISSMPEMLLSASSSGSTTAVAISDGLAPGSCTLTVTVAGSAWGKRSTPRSRNEKMPITTSDMTSIVAKTGRRTLSSERDTWHSAGWIGYLRAGWLVTCAPSASVSTSAAAIVSPAVTPPTTSTRSPTRSPILISVARTWSPLTTKTRFTP